MSAFRLIPPPPFTSNYWEKDLKQWAQSLPPHELGLRLAVLMKTSSPRTGPEASLLEDITHWYKKPDDILRWKIMNKAKKTGLTTPVGALAFSLFLSQGSLTPEGLEPVYANPELSPQILNSALVMFVLDLAGRPEEGIHQFRDLWAREEEQQ